MIKLTLVSLSLSLSLSRTADQHGIEVNWKNNTFLFKRIRHRDDDAHSRQSKLAAENAENEGLNNSSTPSTSVCLSSPSGCCLSGTPRPIEVTIADNNIITYGLYR
eukprot:GHVU01197424.1.p1 GENE.GHVU01197424.1~~GHVU01197424.1.p1  ORF type:complete len:106 (-),score=5.25 GHVU01197424.1:360-677(-)